MDWQKVPEIPYWDDDGYIIVAAPSTFLMPEHDVELLYQKDQRSWMGQDVVIFPIIGGLKDSEYIIDDKVIEEIEKIDEILDRNYGNIRDALKEVGVDND